MRHARIALGSRSWPSHHHGQEWRSGRLATPRTAGKNSTIIESVAFLELRRRLQQGIIKGPRLLAAGRIALARAGGISGAGGRGDAPAGDPARFDRSRPPLRPAEAAAAIPAAETRAAVEATAKAGFDVITTAIIVTPAGPEKETLFRDALPFPFETLSSAGQGPVNARLLWEAGIMYGYGTDTSFLPKDTLATELRPLSLVFSPKDIVTILTRNAAVAIGRRDELGTLEPGKVADIVILNGDPLANVSNLLNVAVVIKGGEVVIDHRRPARAPR